MHRILDTPDNATHTDDGTPILFHAMNGEAVPIIALRRVPRTPGCAMPGSVCVGGQRYIPYRSPPLHNYDIYIQRGYRRFLSRDRGE